jgi:predicted regulator of Ras-like GTPase activity (Roadblock/LC7/MglB family)
MKIRRPQSISIKFENAYLKIDRIRDRKEFLVILAEAITNTGILTLEVKKNLRKLARLLEN